MQTSRDKKLIEGCVSGDPKAQETFVNLFSDPIFRSIQYTLRAKNVAYIRQDLEDLHHTVFMKLFEKRCRKLRQYEGKNGCSLLSWIRLISVRTAIDHIRATNRDAVTKTGAQIPFDRLPDIGTDLPDPLAHLEAAEKNRLVQEGMQRLSSRDRLFLRLHCLQDLPLRTTAAMLDISEANAYSLKHRAIKRLRAEIHRHFGSKIQAE